jgi:hypothetical protein
MCIRRPLHHLLLPLVPALLSFHLGRVSAGPRARGGPEEEKADALLMLMLLLLLTKFPLPIRTSLIKV